MLNTVHIWLQDRPPPSLEGCPMAPRWSPWTRGNQRNWTLERRKRDRLGGDTPPVKFFGNYSHQEEKGIYQKRLRRTMRVQPAAGRGHFQVGHHTRRFKGETMNPHCRFSSPSEPVFQNVSTGPSPSSLHPGLVCPSEATRPPVTRVRSGVWETSRQHELSAIPEVETSFSPSLDTGQRHPHVTSIIE